MNPEIFTADYTGEPGRRAFFLQVRAVDGTLNYAIEKQQIAVLADKLRELLLLVDQQDTVTSAAAARDPALEWVEPLQSEWRVGTIGLAYEESSDQVMVFLQPVEDEAAEGTDEEPGVRFELRRDQVRAFVLHALAIVDEGRPTCQLCGLPMDPSGHQCPASNGHRSTG
jgi:uncharacterized repeat protein (TIGR03847 family)